MNYLESNKTLDHIELSDEYKEFEIELKKTLNEQWSDLIFSGVVIKVLTTLFPNDNIRLPRKKRQINLLKSLIAKKVEKSYIKLSNYDKFNIKTLIYLEKIANFGGQYELNHFIPGIKFNLTNTLYKKEIRNRVKSLLSGMNKYTIKRFTSELVKAIGKSNTKKQVISALEKSGRSIAKIRSTHMLKTETASALEYMRLQVATMNGVQWKRWRTLLDERTCPICRPLNGQVARVGQGFPGGFSHPPVHGHCRCLLHYTYDLSIWGISKSYKFYNEVNTELYTLPGPNINYYWTGGNSYKGKEVDNIIKYSTLLNQFSEEDIRTFFGGKNGLYEYKYFNLEGLIKEIKNTLSKNSFTMLLYTAANRGNVGRPFLIPKD